MNIFWLDRDPRVNAAYHADRHVFKMTIEYAQLLCNAHHICGSPVDRGILYKPTHLNHPCTKWAADGLGNYYKLHTLWLALCQEYTFRRDRVHATERRLKDLLKISPTYEIKSFSTTTPPLCMPDEFKVPDDTVLSYRLYYLGTKQHLFNWSKRPKPEWIV